MIQQNLRAVGIDLDVRTYEFATLFADVLKGNFQMFTSAVDRRLAGRPRHSAARVSFHAGAARRLQPRPLQRSRVDALLDEAASSTDEARRLELFQQVQRLLAVELPYISLWNKTNFIVAQQSLAGVRVSTLGDLTFLKDVARQPMTVSLTNDQSTTNEL